jgi:hypothetical protein
METVTYGSEFVAACIATYQIIDLYFTLMYLGVHVIKKSHLCCDNQAVFLNSAVPHSSLKKRHNALSCHQVREGIAADIFYMPKIPGEFNVADILSKHYGHTQVWSM